MTAVVMFHTSHRPFRAGFIGLDVFFVLSGFLITSVLLREVRVAGVVRFRRFYLRRSLRLYPALVVLLAGTVALSASEGLSSRNAALSAASAALYVSNVWLYTGFMDPFMAHVWSLALEEQFYLVWPIVVVAVHRASPRRKRLIVSAITAVALFLSFVPLGDHGRWHGVVHTYVRAIGLPLGALLAFNLDRARRIPGRWLQLAGTFSAIVLVTAATVPIMPVRLFDNRYLSLASVITVPVIAAVVTPRKMLLSAVLTNPTLRYLGQRSYGIYLWHYPLFVLADRHSAPASSGIRSLAVIGASLLAAELSWRIVETPFLRFKERLSREPSRSAPGE